LRWRSLIREARQARPEGCQEWLERTAATKTTVHDIALQALRFETSRIGTADQRRIITILHRFGWERADKQDSKGRRLYVKSMIDPGAS
jgi:hypothetical protein